MGVKVSNDKPLTLLGDLKIIGEYDDPELIVSKLQQMSDPAFSGEAEVQDKGVEHILNIFNSVQNQPARGALLFQFLAIHRQHVSPFLK